MPIIDLAAPAARTLCASCAHSIDDDPAVLCVGPLHLDPRSRTVTVHDTLVDLSRKEWELLRLLAADPARVFTKAEILGAVWDHHHAVRTTRTLDSHACRLRHKLHAAGAHGWLRNVWGVGYGLLPAHEALALAA